MVVIIFMGGGGKRLLFAATDWRVHFYSHLALFPLTCLSALAWTKCMTNAFRSHKTHVLCRCLKLWQSVKQDKD